MTAAQRARFLAYFEADQNPSFEDREQAITKEIRAAETEAHNKAVEACAEWLQQNLQKYTSEIAGTMAADRMQTALKREPS